MKIFSVAISIFILGVLSGSAVVYWKPWPWSALREAYWGAKSATEEEKSLRIASKFIDLDLRKFSSVDDVSDDDAAARIVPGGGLDAFLDDALLVDGHGRIYLLKIDALQIQRLNIEPPLNGRQALYSRNTGGDEPEYKKSGWHRYTDIAYYDGLIYVIYSHFDSGEECFTTRISRLRITESLAEMTVDASDWEAVFTSTPCFGFRERGWTYVGHQAGGKFAMSADGQTLLVTIGDYGFDGIDGPNYPRRYFALLKAGVAESDVLLVSNGPPQCLRTRSMNRAPSSLPLFARAG